MDCTSSGSRYANGSLSNDLAVFLNSCRRHSSVNSTNVWKVMKNLAGMLANKKGYVED